MVAKVKTNIDPWSNEECKELEIGKQYEVEEVVIHSWNTKVYLKNGKGYNSCMFDDKFQKKLNEAIDVFNSTEDSGPGDEFGVFVRDYC